MEKYLKNDPNHWCKEDLPKFKAILSQMEK